jgi:uncharacterized protein (DUF1499 family)
MQFNWQKFIFIFINCALGSIIIAGCGKSVTGIQARRLMPCPSSPNCVSSYESDKSHHADPLTYTGTREKTVNVVLSILTAMPEAKIIQSDDDYIHAEFRSKIFKFVDDVEFQFVESPPVIHVRSASRVGYSDLGVNRERMEKIRKLFDEKMRIGTEGK